MTQREKLLRSRFTVWPSDDCSWSLWRKVWPYCDAPVSSLTFVSSLYVDNARHQRRQRVRNLVHCCHRRTPRPIDTVRTSFRGKTRRLYFDDNRLSTGVATGKDDHHALTFHDLHHGWCDESENLQEKKTDFDQISKTNEEKMMQTSTFGLEDLSVLFASAK